MPRYDFRCGTCGAVRDVLASYEASRALELICTECGGTMSVAPVLSVNIGGFAAEGVEKSANTNVKSCGHSYACRCAGVKLTRPNPFKEELNKKGAAE